MYSKTFAPGSFHKVCEYVCQDQKRAIVLESKGVRGHDHKLMAEDFDQQRQMRSGKNKAVFHAILSFSPLEKPDDALMVEIARKYLERIGMVNTQYVIVRHIDRPHSHMHIIANLVNNEGRSIKEGRIRLKANRAAYKLTQEYKLIPDKKKNLHLTHIENMNRSDQRRYRIWMEVVANRSRCRDLEGLEKKLFSKGIEIGYRIQEKTGEKIGISFRLENEWFAGGRIDRECTLKSLQRYFELKLELEQEQRLEQELEQRQSHRMGQHL